MDETALFRIYDKDTDRMYPVTEIRMEEGSGKILNVRFGIGGDSTLITGEALNDFCFLMKSLNRKDKDGIDIYTGDIVEFSFEGQDLVGEVFFSDEDSAFEIIIRFGEVQDHSRFFYFFEALQSISVIGDIYRSPILLEKTLGY